MAEDGDEGSAYDQIIEGLLSGKIKNGDELHKAKIQLCRMHKLSHIPPNSEILALIPEQEREKVIGILRIKPTRTLSGVAVIAAMTSPADCPHGKCLYCRGGVEKGTAQSYTGREPAALRAEMNDFDAYKQVKSRLEQLNAIGHSTDKVDLIIMGGTFTSREADYQECFVKGCFDALNGSESPSLAKALQTNEKSNARCIGMTIETRPDQINEANIRSIMRLGATRVELGVQTVFDDILEYVERGHSVRETITATRLAKDAGLKVCYHMMPGLPKSNLERDIEAFKEIFYNSDFKPDMLKIYPTLVVEGTKLHQLWKAGEYKPYSLEETVKLIADIKKIIPPWIRIQRVQRDIPAFLIEAGVKKGNLRQLAQNKLREEGGACNCIRCREVGRAEDGGGSDHVQLREMTYAASGGEEAFLSYETEAGALVGYARLRRPSNDERNAFIRELKVFGEMVPLEDEPGNRWQHRGFGRQLMESAEARARDWGCEKLLVTSGIGARPYYKKLGYELENLYMMKRLA